MFACLLACLLRGLLPYLLARLPVDSINLLVGFNSGIGFETPISKFHELKYALQFRTYFKQIMHGAQSLLAALPLANASWS